MIILATFPFGKDEDGAAVPSMVVISEFDKMDVEVIPGS